MREHIHDKTYQASHLLEGMLYQKEQDEDEGMNSIFNILIIILGIPSSLFLFYMYIKYICYIIDFCEGKLRGNRGINE